MTPEAKQILAQLRDTFYTQFASAMQQDVSITKDNSLLFSPALAEIASWVDDKQRFNYLSVHAHTAPDYLVPRRPLTLQISINPPSGILANTKTVHKKTGLSLNQSWSLKLTVLPEEIVDMAHWVASWIHSQENDSIAIAPPCCLKVVSTDNESEYQVWTQTAWYSLHAQEDEAPAALAQPRRAAA